MKAVNLSKDEFKQLVDRCAGGPVPFVLRLPNDMLTPVVVYANLQQDNQHAFFLDSVETGSRIGRYSFMGTQPRWIYAVAANNFYIYDTNGTEIAKQSCTDPLQALKHRLEPFRAKWPAELELPPLVGGVVGYLSYDCVNYFEPIGDWLPDELDLAEMQWLHTDVVVCFDHLHSTILLCKCLLPEEVATADLDQLYDDLLAELDAYAKTYLQPTQLASSSVYQALGSTNSLPKFTSNHDATSFCQVVESAKENIYAGDVFQIVPSQRICVDLTATPLDVYRALRKINPSAYMFALKLNAHEIVGSSPETQLRCRNRELMMRPLAGSRPRSGDTVVDNAAAAELLADDKELAEHRMLVDLVRNDLGRVAKIGSVVIERLLEVEQYSHVMHLTSEVTAELADDYDIYDALRSTFPAGTLSGAPKVRAMQLINGLEHQRRNLYGGLVGYIDYAGDSDSCIAIRMLMAYAGKAYIQAGCGVVADSVPQTEYEETINKASAVLSAIAQVQQ